MAEFQSHVDISLYFEATFLRCIYGNLMGWHSKLQSFTAFSSFKASVQPELLVMNRNQFIVYSQSLFLRARLQLTPFTCLGKVMVVSGLLLKGNSPGTSHQWEGGISRILICCQWSKGDLYSDQAFNTICSGMIFAKYFWCCARQWQML